MSDLRVGTPDVAPDAPAHRAGIKQGNSTGSYESMVGHYADGRSSAQRSTEPSRVASRACATSPSETPSAAMTSAPICMNGVRR